MLPFHLLLCHPRHTHTHTHTRCAVTVRFSEAEVVVVYISVFFILTLQSNTIHPFLTLKMALIWGCVDQTLFWSRLKCGTEIIKMCLRKLSNWVFLCVQIEQNILINTSMGSVRFDLLKKKKKKVCILMLLSKVTYIAFKVHFLSVLAFPGNWKHNLGVANAILYCRGRQPFRHGVLFRIFMVNHSANNPPPHPPPAHFHFHANSFLRFFS